ncbi:MAG: S-adenosylmethionine:tRNA ribosyltransferase-isomerase [Bacteroidota bacterium]|nr:S-adenosylmethionine:tRNA ribosyltransferase-isomerase [Bacteroidota bacterium]
MPACPLGDIPAVETSQYDYDLPPERIAQTPLAVRDESKLLVADGRTGTISHHVFIELPNLLPAGSFLVRNVTRVIPARIIAHKSSGGHAEILLVTPAADIPMEEALSMPSGIWKCMIGGHRIRQGTELIAFADGQGIRAKIVAQEDGLFLVEIECVPSTHSIAAMLEHLGKMPLPPYIRREPTQEDIERYQTVYAQVTGSIAAPTAGLHFTERIFSALAQRHVEVLDVVLHVGPGTFKPLRAANALEHIMHAEPIIVERSTLVRLHNLLANQRMCVCIGTTSVRTIETLYWLGVKRIVDPTAEPQVLLQHEPYAQPLRTTQIAAAEAIAALIEWLDKNQRPTLEAHTQLYIVPSYRYRIVQAMVTNFHQPRSTLLLLVAAFMGEWWRAIYTEALAQNYRFLSYGDASLLIAPQ